MQLHDLALSERKVQLSISNLRIEDKYQNGVCQPKKFAKSTLFVATVKVELVASQVYTLFITTVKVELVGSQVYTLFIAIVKMELVGSHVYTLFIATVKVELIGSQVFYVLAAVTCFFTAILDLFSAWFYPVILTRATTWRMPYTRRQISA